MKVPQTRTVGQRRRAAGCSAADQTLRGHSIPAVADTPPTTAHNLVWADITLGERRHPYRTAAVVLECPHSPYQGESWTGLRGPREGTRNTPVFSPTLRLCATSETFSTRKSQCPDTTSASSRAIQMRVASSRLFGCATTPGQRRLRMSACDVGRGHGLRHRRGSVSVKSVAFENAGDSAAYPA